jgi:zinc/manganese transport system substrate-binding protein
MRHRNWLIGPVLVFAILAGSASLAQADIRVFACEPEWGALTQEIGGDRVSIYAATTAMQDPHQVQARPSLIARLRNSQVLVCSGAQLEIGWLPVLMIQSANGGIQAGAPGYIMAGDYIHMLDIPAVADRSLGDVHPMGNPHLHTGPQNYLPVANVIAERLAILDPADTDFYQARLKDFTQRWQEAMKRWREKGAPLRGISVVSHHEYWVYLYEFLGIKQVGTLEPKPGVPPSAAHLNELLAQLRFTPAKMVIRTPYDDPRASEFLSSQVHIPQVVLPGTVGGTPKAKDLFGLFDDTIDRLLDGLKGQSDTSIANG